MKNKKFISLGLVLVMITSIFSDTDLAFSESHDVTNYEASSIEGLEVISNHIEDEWINSNVDFEFISEDAVWYNLNNTGWQEVTSTEEATSTEEVIFEEITSEEDVNESLKENYEEELEIESQENDESNANEEEDLNSQELEDDGTENEVVSVNVRNKTLSISEEKFHTIQIKTINNTTSEESEVLVINFGIDKTKPNVPIIEKINTSFKVKDDYDNLSGIKEVLYSFDNVTWTKYEELIPLQKGDNLIYGKVIDRAGNESDVVSATLTYGNPVINGVTGNYKENGWINEDAIFTPSWDDGEIYYNLNNLGWEKINQIKEISTGGFHSLVLLENGDVYSFGKNNYGQLGLGDTVDRNIPTKIKSLNNIKAISAGGSHSLVLSENGDVYAFGYNYYGQLGLGNSGTQNVPTKIENLSNVKSISCGIYYSLALLENGDVYSFGLNSDGQLGVGDKSNRTVPTKIENLSNVKSISGVGSHSLVLLENGEVYSFGYNKYGQLGLGNINNINVPTKISSLSNVKNISTGNFHSLILLENGDIFSFGLNSRGQLGLGDESNRNIPTKIESLGNVKSIVGGTEHSLVLLENGDVYSFGYNNYGQLGLGHTAKKNIPTKITSLSNVKSIFGGYDHYFTLLENGDVYSFGKNDYGQLGVGDTSNRTAPTKVGIGNVRVADEGSHNIEFKVIDSQNNLESQIKKITFSIDKTPPKSSLISRERQIVTITEQGDNLSGVAKIQYSYNNNDWFDYSSEITLEKNKATTIYVKTIDNAGNSIINAAKYDIGDPSINLVGTYDENEWINQPKNVIFDHFYGGLSININGAGWELAPKIKDVSIGDEHSLVLLENGDVYSFGRNNYGQLGVGFRDKTDRNTPTKIEGLSNVKSVYAGENHSLALLENGDVYSFGYNWSGQLGLGNTVDTTVPTKIPNLSNVKSISAGGDYTLVLLENGDVYGFGYNDYGQLGLGDTSRRLVPTKIESLSNVKSISAGGYHSLVLLENGDIYSFGRNNYGQLGLGNKNNISVPTKIESLSNVKSITAGGYRSLIILENGDVYSFGRNNYGQLGLGDTVDRNIPTKIKNLSNVKSISVGWEHSLLLLENGDVYSFGYNYSGQLGLGNKNNISVPTKIDSLKDVKLVIGGGESSVFVSNNNILYGAGSHFYGNLTDLVTNQAYLPTRMRMRQSFLFSDEGEHVIKAKTISNEFSTESNVITVNIKIDKTAPSIPTVTKIDEKTFSLSDNGDNLSGVKEIQYKINENDWEVYESNIEFVDDGAYEIQAKVIDNAGNESKIASYKAIVGVPPISIIKNFEDDSWINKDGVIEVSSYKPVYYNINNEGFVKASLKNESVEETINNLQDKFESKLELLNPSEEIKKQVTKSIEEVYEIVISEEKYHNIEIKAVEEETLDEGPVTTINFGVDKVSPELTVTLINSSDDQETYSISANDSLSGVKDIILPDGTIVSNNSEITLIKKGNHVITARDNANNLKSFTVYNDYVAPNPPTISLDGKTVSIIDNGDNGEVEENPNATLSEDFEDSNYNINFTYSGNQTNWGITTADKYEGLSSMKSAAITHYQKTAMEFTVEVKNVVADNLSFYYKTSSESSYDWFRVYINGTEVLKKSGNGSWTNFSYTMPEGINTIKFEYSKDGSGNSYNDCVYIDSLSLLTDVPQINYEPSGVKEIQYKINDGVYQKYNGEFNLDYGTYTITAKVIDNKENESVEEVVTFNIEVPEIKNISGNFIENGWVNHDSIVNIEGNYDVYYKLNEMEWDKLKNIEMVSAGGYHSLILLENGDVYSFGRNADGQLGLGHYTDKNVPTKIESLSNVKSIAAGGNFSLILLENGDVYSFGRNAAGELGLGDKTSRNVPTKIESLSNVKSIAASEYHSLILLENGDVYSFGINSDGQLGLGHYTNKNVPTKIESLSNVKSIAAGFSHSLILLENGDVYSFGKNTYGQLGLGNTTTRSAPIKIESISNAKAIAAGYYHSLILLENGDVYSFGYNSDGQLGLGHYTNKNVPTKIEGLSNVKSMAAGYTYSLILLENEDVYSFGYNSYGQLGLGDTNNRNVPTKIESLSNVKSIATGRYHSLILLKNKDVYSFGYNTYGQLGLGNKNNGYTPTKINSIWNGIDISDEGEYTILCKSVDPDNNNESSIKTVNFGIDKTTPEINVEEISRTDTSITYRISATDNLSGVSEIYIWGEIISGDSYKEVTIAKSGYYYIGAIDNAGNIAEYTLEVSEFDSEPPLKPSIVLNEKYVSIFDNGDRGDITIIDGETIEGPASGVKEVQYKIDDGEYKVYEGEIKLDYGAYEISAKVIDNKNNESDIETVSISVERPRIEGFEGNYVENGWVNKDVSINVIGNYDIYSKLNDMEWSSKPGIKSIAGGWTHTLILLENGDVYSVGYNEIGQLGLGDWDDRNIPQKIEGISDAKAIAAGGNHSLILLENGDVYSFGNNGYGQLGLGDWDDRNIPQKIEGISDAKAIAAGGNHSLILLENGDVYSFGDNEYGKLGLGDWDDRNIPQKIEGISDAKAIAAGGNHSLILLENGDVYSFGNNEIGQLGLGDYNDRNTPTKIEGLSNVKSMAAGFSDSLILLENGDVYSFGYNGWGELGLGDYDNRNTPTKINGLSNVKNIGTGAVHSLILLENGDVYSFGYNGYGQLGLGDYDDRNTPTLVNLEVPLELIVKEEGFHELSAKSVDPDGNVESEIKTLAFGIDKTAPLMPTMLKKNNKIILTHNGDTLSGVKEIQYRENESNWKVYTNPIELYGDTTIIEAKVIDNAGNESLIVKEEFMIDTLEVTMGSNSIDFGEITFGGRSEKTVQMDISSTFDYCINILADENFKNEKDEEFSITNLSVAIDDNEKRWLGLSEYIEVLTNGLSGNNNHNVNLSLENVKINNPGIYTTTLKIIVGEK